MGPESIEQGSIGNCYFLSACCALASDPKKIRDLFVTQSYNEQGKYIIKLYIGGQPQQIEVDEFIPIKQDTNQPAFCKSKGMWAMLLEKVWAKINGSYESTICGYSKEALEALTGAPTKNFSHQKIDE